MATIFKRGRFWYIDYRQNGTRVQRSLGVTSKRLAEIKRGEIELNIERGLLGLGKRVESSKAAFDGFTAEVLEKKSPPWKKRAKQLLRSFREWAESKPELNIARLSTSEIEAFLRNRLQDVATKTLNEELSMIKRFYRWLVDREYLVKDPAAPIDRLKQIPKEIRVFTTTEISMIFKYATPHTLPFFKMLLYTGLRDGELRNLEWDDVDLERKTLFVRVKKDWIPKTSKGRAVPLASEAIGILRNLPNRGSYVFSTRNGRKWAPPRQPWVSLLGRILENEGVDLRGQVSIHTFRHTFATICLMQGVDIKTVSEFLGHTSVRMTEKYLHILPEHKSREIRKVDFTKLISEKRACTPNSD